VAAHEYEEMLAVAIPELQRRYVQEWPHFVAIMSAPDTELRIADFARELLRLQRRAVGLE